MPFNTIVTVFSSYSVSDCRALVKTLVCGVKTITWGCTSVKDSAAVAAAAAAAAAASGSANAGSNPGANNAAAMAAALASAQSKQFQPKETLVYIRLVKWAMEALDIYTLNATPGTTTGPASAGGQTASAGGVGGLGAAVSGVGGPAAAGRSSAGGGVQPIQQAVRTKEEKEVLEHFAGVFALLNPLTFKEVFSQTIDYVVERIYRNYALQV